VWVDLLRVVAVASWVERARTTLGPAAALTLVRRRGAARQRRDAEGRGRLARAIRVLDRFMPPGANCYRRVLLELALDAGAAREPVSMGFRSLRGRISGHAWLGAAPDDLFAARVAL